VKQLIILAFILISSAPVYPQALDLYVVYIRGKVTEAETGEPVQYAHVINPGSHSGTTTNADGMFTIRMLTEDTLIIRAVGYVDATLFIEEFPPKQLYEVVLKPVRFLIGEVTVTEELNMRRRLGLPDAEPLDIPVELRGDAFNERPPWFAAFLTPLSFVQYHTSKREKQKRETLQVIKNNEEWLEYSKFFNLVNIERLTGLYGAEADNFMLYCNINNRLPWFASQMEIEFQIMDFFFKWKREQAALKEKELLKND
jgi:hypothetical protein